MRSKTLGLKLKFTIMAVSIALVSFALTAFLSNQWMARDSQKVYKEKAELIRTHIIYNLESAMKAGTRGEISRVLGLYRTYEGVKEVRIFDLKGREVCAEQEGSDEPRVKDVDCQMFLTPVSALRNARRQWTMRENGSRGGQMHLIIYKPMGPRRRNSGCVRRILTTEPTAHVLRALCVVAKSKGPLPRNCRIACSVIFTRVQVTTENIGDKDKTCHECVGIGGRS